MVKETAAIIGRLFRLVPALLFAGFMYYAFRLSPVFDLALREREGLGIVILLVGNIYAVMFAFVIFVIWSQFTEVENFVMRECNSLNELLRFAEHLDPESGRQVRRAVEDYVHHVAKSEWRALAERRRDRETEKAFRDVMAVVIQMKPSPGEEASHQRLIEIARRAGEHRDERITKSMTRIPATLERLVKMMALALLVLVFLYPFQQWFTGFPCFTLLAIVLLLANLVMTDTDNPFEGICNISAKPFLDLLA